MLWWTLRQLKSQDPDKRACAARVLGGYSYTFHSSFERAIESLRAAGTDKSWEVRLAAVGALQKLLAFDIAEFIEAERNSPDKIALRVSVARRSFSRAAEDEHPTVREAAAAAQEGLVHLAVEALGPMVRDRGAGSDLRRSAVAALGALNHAEAVPELLRLIPFGDMAKSAEAAIAAMGAAAVPALLAVQEQYSEPFPFYDHDKENEHYELEMLRWIVSQLFRKIPASALVRPLCAALRSQDGEIGKRAAGRLKDLLLVGDCAWTPFLIEQWSATLDGADVEIRRIAASALGDADVGAVEPLLLALRDDDSGVRKAAVESLEKLKDPRAVEPLIMTLRDEDSGVRKASVEWLAKLKDPRAVDLLLLALHDEDSGVRKAAVESLEKLKDSRAGDALATTMQDSAKALRCAAARALVVIGDLRGLEPLLALLHDGEADVARSAAKVLKRCSRIPAEDAERVARCLAEYDRKETLAARLHGDGGVRGRLAAVAELEKMGGPRSSALLVVALGDRDTAVRAEAARALKAIGAAAIEPLRAALKGASPASRIVMAEILAAIDDSRAPSRRVES